VARAPLAQGFIAERLARQGTQQVAQRHPRGVAFLQALAGFPESRVLARRFGERCLPPLRYVSIRAANACNSPSVGLLVAGSQDTGTGSASQALSGPARRSSNSLLWSASAWRNSVVMAPRGVSTTSRPPSAVSAASRRFSLEHRVHDTRHSTATYLLAAGVDPRIVLAIMAWSQISMLKRYQHVLPAMLSDAATRLEAVFPAARKAV
jgi:hypothetical protein